jgi:flagellar basal body-associated protein FliL
MKGMEERMAEAVTSEETHGKKGSLGKILLLGLNAILFLSGVGFFLLTKFGVFAPPVAVAPNAVTETPQQVAVAAPAAEQSEAPVQVTPSVEPVVIEGEGVLVELKPFVVNLQSERRSRYLRVAIELQLAGAKWEEELNKRLPHVRNRLIFLLSNQAVDDISNVDGKYQLQAEIVQHVNETLGKAIVHKAFFTDFIVQ